MPELLPGGYQSGFLTMAQGMGEVNDRAARLQAFLEGQPVALARQQAELQAQQQQNQTAPMMTQMKMYGSPWEQQQFAQQQQQQAIQNQNAQTNIQRQIALEENTLSHSREQEANARDAAKRQWQVEQRKLEQPIWDADSQLWRFPPGGSRLSGQQGQPAANATGATDLSGAPQQTPILSHRKGEMAIQISNDMQKQLHPITELESDLAQIQQLLKTGSPLAHEKVNEKLISLLDPNRTSGQLLARNQQFGDLVDRTVQHVGKFFTGKYTEESQQQIQNIISEMKARVVAPAKENISQFYKTRATQVGINPKNIEVPNFFETTPSATPAASVLEFRGYRFPSKASLDKYKKDNNLE